MPTVATGTIKGAGAANAVPITPGGSDNVAAIVVSGDYTGFSGVFESSSDGVTFDSKLPCIAMDNYATQGPYINPPSNATRTYLFNITAANKAIRLRPLSYGAGSVSVGLASGIVAGGWPVILPGAITRADQSATAAAQAMTLTMPAVAGKTNYVEGVTVNGNGATASLLTIATLAGGYQGSLKFPFFVPVGANTPLGQFAVDVTFQTPVSASQPNLAVTLTVPSFGAGNTLANATLRGYVQ